MVFAPGLFGDGSAENSGLCLTCARELGIPQVEAMMRRMGVDDESLEETENSIAEMASSGASPIAGIFGEENAEKLGDIIKKMAEDIQKGKCPDHDYINELQSEMLNMLSENGDFDPESFDIEGNVVSATSSVGEDLKAQLNIDTNLDTSTPGMYEIHYRVTDGAGKLGHKIAIVVVE